MTQTIELFNFNTQTYEQIQNRNIALIDVKYGGVVTRDVTRFTNKLRARVTITPAGTISTNWTARFDQFIWTVTP